MADKDAAAKARIITHMNNDHRSSLSYYLQHFCHVSPSEASSPTLLDVTFSSFTISSSSGAKHTIPLSPPMTSWAEARTRTIDLDREARTALDISPYTITSYTPPSSPLHITVFGLCAMTAVFFATKNYMLPGTFWYDKVLKWFPGGPETFLWLVKGLQPVVLAIHIGETWLLDRTRLRKYGVVRGSAVWWKWVVSCLIEGFGCFQRIDDMIKQKKAEAETAKH